ncbi:MAG: hypothetical protein A2Z20_03630 [Bdellovibrionales bacterium RBG_16_40_8]|nr:MAG: hypothetical protein A2Z20_03630 [Bdellovibrionales bacterium RBG_16_40_8]
MNESENSNPGEVLRVSRERLGLSIGDVSMATKISPRVLKALEEGNKSALPPYSFSRGFIRSYAAYLKIDSKPILEAYSLKDNTIDNLSSKAASEKKVVTKKVAPFTTSSITSKILIVGGILIAALIVFGIKNVVDKYANERIIEDISEVQNRAIKDQNVTTDKPDISVSSKEDSPTESTATPPPLPPPLNVPETVVPKEVEINANTEIKIEPKLPAPTLAKNPQEVIIEALDAVEISAVIDGESAKSFFLKPEEIHTIKAASSLILNIKDGGMVNIIHNGRERGVPGDLGRPMQLKFP